MVFIRGIFQRFLLVNQPLIVVHTTNFSGKMMVKLGMVDPIALLALHFLGGNGHGRAQWHTAMHWQSFVLLLRVLIPT